MWKIGSAETTRSFFDAAPLRPEVLALVVSQMLASVNLPSKKSFGGAQSSLATPNLLFNFRGETGASCEASGTVGLSVTHPFRAACANILGYPSTVCVHKYVLSPGSQYLLCHTDCNGPRFSVLLSDVHVRDSVLSHLPAFFAPTFRCPCYENLNTSYYSFTLILSQLSLCWKIPLEKNCCHNDKHVRRYINR